MNRIIILSVLFLVADILWLKANETMYRGVVERVQCGKPFRFRALPAVVVYIAMLLAFFRLAHFPAREALAKLGTSPALSARLWLALSYAGLLGFGIYATYGFTNYALFEDIQLVPTLIDTAWGVFLFTLIGFIGLSI